MNAAYHSAPRSARRQGVAFALLFSILVALCLALLVMVVITGCTAAQEAKVQSATSAITADVQSPAGQSILADVSSAALNAGLDVATGNESGAIISGIQGAASAIRDYEGLPTAPSAATIANAAAAGSGVAQVATTVAPTIGTIIANATKSASAQKVSVSIDSIIEAAARGLDAVAAAKVSLARTKRVSVCYAELPCEQIARRQADTH